MDTCIHTRGEREKDGESESNEFVSIPNQESGGDTFALYIRSGNYESELHLVVNAPPKTMHSSLPIISNLPLHMMILSFGKNGYGWIILCTILILNFTISIILTEVSYNSLENVYAF